MGRDKGKFNKRGGRGGGSRFQATSAEEIEQRNNRIAQFDERRAKRRAEEDDDDDNADDNADDNKIDQDMGRMNISGDDDGEPKPMTRKQREEADKARKAAEYRKRHEAGLTEEYKRDMAKLAEVRKRREEAAKKAAAEKEMSEAMEADRKTKLKAAEAAALEDDDDDDSDDDGDKKKKKKSSSKKKDSIPKLDKIAMKKMKPTQLKEALKARGLDIQGNAKTLLKRLVDYEESR